MGNGIGEFVERPLEPLTKTLLPCPKDTVLLQFGVNVGAFINRIGSWDT